MHRTQQSTVVDSTLRELFIRNRQDAVKAHRTTVLVLLFHHMDGLERDLHELKEFHDHQIRVRICPDEHILDHYDVNELARRTGIDDWISMKDAEIQKEQFDHLYIPILPFSTVSDLIHFNDARPSIRIVLWALMRGKKVSAFSAGADPYHTVWQDSGLHHGTALLKREMKKQLLQMRGFGIQLVEKEDDLLNHFLGASQSESNQVITADTIMKYAKEGKSYLEVNHRAIITPLARDTARKYKLEIGEKKGR